MTTAEPEEVCGCGREHLAHRRVHNEPGTLGYGPCDDCRCMSFKETR